jgi:hypothetical protein
VVSGEEFFITPFFETGILVQRF